MTDGPIEQIKKFVFKSRSRVNGDTQGETLEIFIPELLQASYSFYTWPSASVLAWFLWEHRHELPRKRILELGSGTSLPGIIAAKSGAEVTLTDSATLPKSLQHIHRCLEVNNLVPGKDVRVLGLTWGLFLHEIALLGPIDLLIASDCFYEPSLFEDILVTVSYILEQNTSAKFVFTYQERSSDWFIDHLLTKWDLKCCILNTNSSDSDFNVSEISGDHSIHLFEITRI